MIGLLLAVGLASEDPATWIRDLEGDNLEARDQAASDLLAVGAAALPALHGSDAGAEIAEVILDAIEADLKGKLTASRRCRGRRFPCPVMFHPPDPALARLFPDCRLVLGWVDGGHCYQRCVANWAYGISRRTGETFFIRRTPDGRASLRLGSARTLGRHMRPVADFEEAMAAVALITGMPRESPDLITWDVGELTVVRASIGGQDQEFTFDGRGRLIRIGGFDFRSG